MLVLWPLQLNYARSREQKLGVVIMKPPAEACEGRGACVRLGPYVKP